MDFTNLIRKKEMRNSFLFNPTIVWVSKDLYLVATRSFLRSARQRIDSNPDLIENRNSPWRGGGKSDKWWWMFTSSGEDMTYFALFEIKVNKTTNKIEMKKIRDYDLKIDGSDARLFRNSPNSFILTYNILIDWDDPDTVLKGGERCSEEDWCMLIQQSNLSFEGDNYEKIIIDKTSEPALCLNLSENFEKNWSYWKYDRHNFISYIISPQHEAYTYTTNMVDGCFVASYPSDEGPNFIEQLKWYYQHFGVGLTTPAYPLFGKKRYVGVGHYKLEYKKRFPRDSPYKKFFKKYNTPKIHNHPYFQYFLFFYEFEVKKFSPEIKYEFDVQLTRLSPAYMIEGFEPYLLDFPSGLAYQPQQKMCLITYGEADMKCKIFAKSLKEIDGILKPIETLTPETYPFEVLKVTT